MLYDLEKDMDLILDKMGINPASPAFRHASAAVLLEAKKLPETPTLRLGGEINGRIAISCGQKYYFIDDMTVCQNGMDVVFTDTIEPWQYARGTEVRKLMRKLKLTADDIRCLYALLMTLFSGDPVPMLQILGPRGSGKTTLQRLLFLLVYGKAVHPIAMPKEKRDFISALHQRRIVAIDNLEDAPTWFQDIACTAVTGGVLTERKLYTNTGVVNITLDNWLITSSIDASSIQRDDVVSRSLFLERGEITEYVSEEEISDLILQSRDAILSHVVDLMRKPEVPAPLAHRMVAWNKNANKVGLDVDKIITNSQKHLLGSIPLLNAVRMFIDMRPERPHRGTVFYAVLCEFMKLNRMSTNQLPDSWVRMCHLIQRYAPEFEKNCGLTLRQSGDNVILRWE